MLAFSAKSHGIVAGTEAREPETEAAQDAPFGAPLLIDSPTLFWYLVATRREVRNTHMNTDSLPNSNDLTIEFTSVPAYGSYVNLKGVVRDVDPEKVRVAVYIRVFGGWWTKPYWDAPATPIAPDGTFSVNITTGGQDDQASDVVALLIPAEYYPPGLRGEPELPAELLQKALARTDVTRST